MAKIKKLSLKRRPGYLLYIDGAGDVAETKMKRGAKKGHKTCKAPKKKRAAPKKKRATKRKAAKTKKR